LGEAGGGELGEQDLGDGGVGDVDALQLNLADAAKADGAGGGVGEVDDAVVDHGAAVVDADEDCLAVAQIGDANPASEGEGAMGAGEGVHIEVFAGGGLVSLEVEAVPGGLAGLEPLTQAADGGDLWGGGGGRGGGYGLVVVAGDRVGGASEDRRDERGADGGGADEGGGAEGRESLAVLQERGPFTLHSYIVPSEKR
jgi:hypothetical protein